MAGFNLFPVMSARMHQAIKEIVAETASELETEMQIRAPVNTGYLMDSIYSTTAYGSSYGVSSYGGKEAFPEEPPPEDDHTAYVAVAAEYGAFVEMGTRKMGAQPYFFPAVEALRPEFTRALSKLERRMRG